MLAGRRDRFAHWLLLSALIHALGALWLGSARRAAPFVPPAPLVLTVSVVAGPPAQKPPAPIAPPVAAAPPALPKPGPPQAPPRPRPSRTPVENRVEPVAPVPAAPSAAAPSVPAPVESAATAGSASTAGVGAGPALAALGTAAAVGPAAPAPTPAALDAYIALVHRAIEKHKSYPALARRRGIEGSVTVRIAIDPAGALEQTELVGFAPEILARATREAVERAKPFPPPPHGALQLEIPVRYEIEE